MSLGTIVKSHLDHQSQDLQGDMNISVPSGSAGCEDDLLTDNSKAAGAERKVKGSLKSLVHPVGMNLSAFV